MPTRYDDTDEDLRSPTGSDREISLGTGTILGIFLALALVCSLFFGLGYSMGRKVSPTTVSAASPTSRETAPAAEEKAFPAKPSGNKPEASSASSRSDLQVAQPSSSVADPDGSIVTSVDRPASKASRDAVPAASKATAATSDAAPSVAPGFAATYVQVAAVSRKEDADLLMTALKRRGYTGSIRPQPQDKLLHIQVGPFPTRKDAEAMRQRLMTDGYNPILK